MSRAWGVRRIIKSAAPLGFKPDDVRGMIPRDWILVVQGHEAANRATKPGSKAPSEAEVAALVRKYG